jgi:hypothetical protein
MAWTFVAVGTGVTGANAVVPLPTGWALGDLLVIQVGNGTISTPSGWTVAAASAGNVYVFYKIAGASESSVTLSGGSSTTSGAMLAWRGIAGLDVVAANVQTGSSTAPATNSITTTAVNDLVISFYGSASSPAATWTAPGSTTTRRNLASTGTVSGALIVDENQINAGATTARTATLSTSDGWTGVAVSFKQTPAWTFVASGAVANGSNPIVALPTGWAQGNLLVLVSAAGSSQVTPTGWTAIILNSTTLSAWYKVAGSSEASVSLNNGGSTTGTAVMLAYNGTRSVTDVIGAVNNGTSTSPATTSLTTTGASDLVISIFDSLSTADTWTAPSSTNARATFNANGTYEGLLVVDENQINAGATTARTATLSVSQGWRSIAVSFQHSSPATSIANSLMMMGAGT